MNNNRHCRKHICHIGWCVQFNLCSHLSKLMLRYISGSNFPIPEKIIHGIFISVKEFFSWKKSFFFKGLHSVQESYLSYFQSVNLQWPWTWTCSPSICILFPICQLTMAFPRMCRHCPFRPRTFRVAVKATILISSHTYIFLQPIIILMMIIVLLA